MLCFRDMSFCSDAEQCKNHKTCERWYSPDQADAAKRWWRGDGAPVTFMEFRQICDKWERVE